MDFFQAQLEARRRQRRLLVGYAVSVAANSAVAGALVWMLFHGTGAGAALWLGVSAAFAAVVVLVSYLKVRQLKEGGGRLIAENMGAQRLAPDVSAPFAQDPAAQAQIQQLLNVVAEMAVASGMAVPPVYLLPEDEVINAFSAGFGQADTVIAVTSGCLNYLTRAELQALAAHEFGHIRSGDTHLNTLMVGVLYGLSVLPLLGGSVLFAPTPVIRLERPRPPHLLLGSIVWFCSAVGLLFVMMGGWLFLIVGALGWVCAEGIKKSLNRNSEFAADAQAVEFTRQSRPLAEVLRKIGGLPKQSWLFDWEVSQTAHMLFADESNRALEPEIFATHPPLAARIARIWPQWDGSYPTPQRLSHLSWQMPEPVATDELKLAAVLGVAAIAPLAESEKARLAQGELAYARQIIRYIPDDWLACARSGEYAVCVVLALLGSQDAAVWGLQHQAIRAEKQIWADECAKLMRERGLITVSQRLPLLEIALPQLTHTFGTEFRFNDLKKLLKAMIAADGKLSSFEWCVYTIVTEYLGQYVHAATPFRQPVLEAGQTQAAAGRLLELFAYACLGADLAASACAKAYAALGYPMQEGGVFKPIEAADFSELPGLVGQLKHMDVLQKPFFMKALVEIARFNGTLAPKERELLRAIALSLENPLPPL